MNLNDLHSTEKSVSAVSLFKGGEGVANSLHMLKDALLKEHVTKVPALLVCVTGAVTFENERGAKIDLLPGDYINIEPLVIHWVKAISESDLLLVK